MSHSIQPVSFAHGSTRNVVGSATIRKSPAPSISGMPKPPPAANTGKTVRCEVSLASSVVVMVTPLRMAREASDGHQRLAAQHAVLIGEREAHDLELAVLDRPIDLGRGLELLVAPQPVALDETQCRRVRT